MPGIVKVKVIEGRNLPVMDRSADTTDAYVELKLGSITYKSDVHRKSLNPQWNTEWYKFEMADVDLQDEPLQVRVMDYDTYSANDLIGKVYFNLNPLLLGSIGETRSVLKTGLSTSPGSGCISGWFPIYDTINGLRGEINIIIKLELFSDINKFRQSSCGVHIFSSSMIPYGCYTENIYGFVEELVVEDDPEYQWIEKIRSPRASNEARQAIFYKMSGVLQRQIGMKVVEMGGNAIIGYRQCFDLEGETGGVVVRGIGTAVKLNRYKKLDPVINRNRNTSEGDKEDDGRREAGLISDASLKNRSLSDAGTAVKYNECAKDTSQDKESFVSSSSSSMTDCRGHNVIHRENLDLMEYPFLTLSTYPEDFIIHLGGTVSARSVKLLDRISNPEEPETRDAWWTELRIEIKSHMRALACNAVLNYVENTSICEEVCLLSVTGTAALVKVFDGANPKVADDNPSSKSVSESEQMKSEDTSPVNCSIFHIPYRKSSLPFPVNIRTCGLCRKGFVADVTFVTIEPLDKMPVVGQSSFIHAFVYRHKRDCRSELNAREISEGLPFLEYELNRQLINKLRIKGMNAIFGLNVHVSVGEKMIAAYATGTAVLLSVLPAPPELTLATHSKTFMLHPNSRRKLNDISKLVEDTMKQNKIHYQLIEFQSSSEPIAKSYSQNTSFDSSIHDQYPEMEYFANSKKTCVIEVDDEDDLEIIAQSIDSNPPQGFFVSATEKLLFGSLAYLPKRNIQLVAQVYRYRIPNNTPPTYFNKYFHRIVQALYMKIHHRIPCSLNKVSFKINIPDSDELQIQIVGMGLALKESDREIESMSTSCSSVSELVDDIIFGMDGEKNVEQLETLSTLTPMKQSSKKRDRRTDVFDTDIQITSLSYVPGANINFYLGNLNFVFIRESSMSKEHPGGANHFVNNFLSDIVAIVKSHAAGIGGNAVVNFFLNECLLTTHSHKNQCQCLMHVGGDVVRYIHRSQ